jgi:hypothetical protein
MEEGGRGRGRGAFTTLCAFWSFYLVSGFLIVFSSFRLVSSLKKMRKREENEEKTQKKTPRKQEKTRGKENRRPSFELLCWSWRTAPAIH